MLNTKKLLTKILQWIKSTKRISTINVFVNHAYKATSANWEYIGKSFTVPAGEAYLAWIGCGFNSGRPIGAGFNGATTLTVWNVPNRGYIENSNGVERTPLFYLTGGATYYVFVKRETTPNANNNHSVYAVRIFV